MPRVASIDNLTPSERTFAQSYANGMTQTQAATAAGYASPAQRGRDLLLREDIREVIAELYSLNAEAAGYSRKEFVADLKEALDMGRQLSDPVAMIAAARELGKACGYYAETKVTHEVKHSGEVMHRMEQLPDSELIKLIEKGDVIDVPHTTELENDT